MEAHQKFELGVNANQSPRGEEQVALNGARLPVT